MGWFGDLFRTPEQIAARKAEKERNEAIERSAQALRQQRTEQAERISRLVEIASTQAAERLEERKRAPARSPKHARLCICGCLGRPGVTNDWSLYQRCPARLARKAEESAEKQARREREAEQRRLDREKAALEEKRKKAIAAEKRRLRERQEWEERHQANLPAKTKAEAEYRGLTTYEGKKCKHGHIGRDIKGRCLQCRDHDRRLRDAMKRGAYPEDLTPAERMAIQAIYEESQRLTKETGVQHHVDHIKPLAAGGRHHPDNLQVITAVENLSKGSKWDDGDAA